TLSLWLLLRHCSSTKNAAVSVSVAPFSFYKFSVLLFLSIWNVPELNSFQPCLELIA
ncbi:hypothetical protein A2U01_0070401, partial [Trifolium medium]|nr:hypothetical protein [Trifolium medium]